MTVPSTPMVFTRRQALDTGLSAEALRHRLRTGRWRTLARGAYCTADTWDGADLRGRHLLHARAALLAVRGDAWVSHETAAALYALPLPRRLGPVRLTRPVGRPTRYGALATIRVATLPAADRHLVAGLPATSRRRTVADCLRSLPPPDALAVLDAAAAGSRQLVPDVVAALAGCAGWPGAQRAARVLALADGRRESPLESWSAWCMHLLGIGTPQPQATVYDVDGTFLGRVDFWWEEAGVVGEADGAVKYAVEGTDPRRAQRALVEEKRREDRLRRAGLEVVRWGAQDLRRPQRWARDLAEVLGRRPGRFRGTVTVPPP